MFLLAGIMVKLRRLALSGALQVKASYLAFGPGNDGVLDVINLHGGTDHHWLSLVFFGGRFASMWFMVVSGGGKTWWRIH